MRLLIAPLINLFKLLWTLLWLPVRLLGRGSRPEYVRFRLTGDPPYRRLVRRDLRFWKKTDPAAIPSLEVLRRSLRRVTSDPVVRGVIFEVDGLEVSPAKRQALVELFAFVRQQGKEIIGYGVSISNSEYELLCATDRILLPAAGRVELTGFSAELSAIGEGLSRLGVTAHFIRRGDYKTAPELFTRADTSPIQQQTVGALLDERYAALVQAIASGRKLSDADARARIDAGPYSARKALAQGLVDGLCSEPDLANLLAPKDRKAESETERPEARIGTFAAWESAQVWPEVNWRRLRRPVPVGVVAINGMIAEGKGGTMPAGPVIAGSITVLKALDAARENPRVPAVVLYVSSPGGSAPASEMILEGVRRLSEKKPVVAYFDRVAASGGYMAVCGAKEIWAGTGAIAGSIGVFAGKFDLSGLFARLGIHRTLIARGENAGLLTSSRGFTPHERSSLEASIDETYDAFLDIVANARGRTKEEIHARGEGRVFSAARAAEEGLVDHVGGFEEACRRAMILAGKTPPERLEVVVFGARAARPTLLSLLTSLSRTTVYNLWYPWLDVSGERAWRAEDGV